MGEFKHLIFDCDGVLIDTEIVAAEVVSEWMRSEGMSITVDEFIQHHTGKKFSDILQGLIASGELRSDLDIAATMELLEPEVSNNMRPINGVSEVLGSLDVPKSVVSNSHVAYVEDALDKFGWSSHFNTPVFSAELVEKGKPSPLVYQLAIETIGVEASDLIAVEDSYTGVQAAIAAGIPTIGFLGGSHIREGHAERLQSLGVFGLARDHQELTQILHQLTH